MKKSILLLGLIATLTIIVIPQKTNAQETSSVKEVTKTLNEQEISKLIDEDLHFRQEYEKYTNMGCSLTEVKETVVYDGSNARYVNSLGKTVESTYKQLPVKKTIYNNKIANNVAGLNSYFQVALGASTKYLWIPVTYFNVSTDNLSFMLSNGRQEIIQDETYHLKSAYTKDGNNYWIGHQASSSNFAVTVINIFTDKNKNPHHDSRSHEYRVKSVNYDNDAALIRIANNNYKQGNPWTEEFPKYPSSVYMN